MIQPYRFLLVPAFALVCGMASFAAYAQQAPVAPAPDAAEAAPVAAPPSAPTAPDSVSVPEPKPPEPPKATGPTYNPPPPSGKDWGKLPQDAREQILNEWKAMPEKDREPFIFYRERAMAKLPDSAYSDNPYKPESAESLAAKAAAEAKGAGSTTPATAPAVAPAADSTSSGSFLDKIMGKDDNAADKAE